MTYIQDWHHRCKSLMKYADTSKSCAYCDLWKYRACCCNMQVPNQKNIYDAALALIAIMYGIMQGIIAVASLFATMTLYRNGRDPQWCMSGIHTMYYSYHCSLIGQSPNYYNKQSLSKSNHRIPSLSISAYERHMAGKAIETVAHVWNQKHISLRINGVSRNSHRRKQRSDSYNDVNDDW